MQSLLHFCGCKRTYGMKMFYMNYTSGHTHNFTAFNYNYYNVDNKATVYVEVILRDAFPYFTARIKLDMLRADNTKINLLNTTQSGCQMIEAAYSKNRLLQILSKEIRRVSTFPKKCPLHANTSYYVKNYTIDPDLFPSFLPPLHWVIRTQFFKGNIYYGYMILYGSIYKL
ncbi:unnamed protein product [Ceratitis capitata]|uniref:(Mediterranean fruit fly) hypothetical protein n=1 Tax=Ceratitis capitata TaxID=7213 RepID=A0A811UXJ9_CERCA|nr:unnamed protein product [Ceratitis capitata]